MKKLYITLLAALVACGMHTAKAQSEATFYTTMGTFTVALTDTLTPITVDSFISRCADKFYDGIIFHRVIDGFMIQGGGFSSGGAKNVTYTLPDEFHPSLSNVQKTISMANSGPNSGSTQFFINLVNNTGLDYDKAPSTSKHPVFGTVISNFNVVQDIGKVPTSGTGGNPQNKPLTDVVMDSVRITKFPQSVGQYYGNKSAVNIYPNPSANNVFYVDVPREAAIVVTDLSGKAVFSTATQQQAKVTVDMSAHPRGIYLVRMEGDGGSAYGRIVVR